MTTERNTPQPPATWRPRAAVYSLAAAAALALAPIAGSVTAPVTVEARMMDEVAVPCDFITSGGFVVSPETGKKANFGVHGGCKNGDFWGHLNFVDHANGYHVQSVAITGYIVAPNGNPNTRDVCGIAQTNSQDDPEQVAFVVRLVDNGEPGGLDQFGMKLANQSGYSVPLLNLGTARPGGNVQLHGANASTAQWPPTLFGTCGISFENAPE